MKKLNDRILERVYRRLLRENETQDSLPVDYAKKIVGKLASAAEGGIGMLTRKYEDSGIQIVLYRTNVFVGNILAYIDPVTKVVKENQIVADAVENSIVGMIVVDKPDDACNGAMVVKYVFSKEKGFGPILYEIAMRLSPSGRIMSDRAAVSDMATNVYKTFHQRGDVKKKPLDDNNIPMSKRKTPDDPSDDCEVWNHENRYPGREFLDYSFEGSPDVNIDALKKNHEQMKEILERHVDPDAWYEFMKNVANMMFMKVYHDIPRSEQGRK